MEMLEGQDKQALTMDQDNSDGDIVSLNKSSLTGAEKVFSSYKEPKHLSLRYPDSDPKLALKNSLAKTGKEEMKMFSLHLQETEAKLIKSLDNPLNFESHDDDKGN